MKLLCSSYSLHRCIINTTFTFLHGFAPFPETNVLTPPALSGILHYPLLLPRLGLALMGKRGRMTYTCFLQWPSLPVPSMKTGELEVSGNQMKGLSGHGGWHFSPLMVPAAEAKIKVMQHVGSDRLPVRQERCYVSKQGESYSEGRAVLHSYVNHCLQLIWTSQRWIWSDVVKKISPLQTALNKIHKVCCLHTWQNLNTSTNLQ